MIGMPIKPKPQLTFNFDTPEEPARHQAILLGTFDLTEADGPDYPLTLVPSHEVDPSAALLSEDYVEFPVVENLPATVNDKPKRLKFWQKAVDIVMTGLIAGTVAVGVAMAKTAASPVPASEIVSTRPVSEVQAEPSLFETLNSPEYKRFVAEYELQQIRENVRTEAEREAAELRATVEAEAEADALAIQQDALFDIADSSIDSDAGEEVYLTYDANIECRRSRLGYTAIATPVGDVGATRRTIAPLESCVQGQLEAGRSIGVATGPIALSTVD